MQRLSGRYNSMFDSKRLRRVERVVVGLAVVGFVAHLALVFVSQLLGDDRLGWYSSSYLAAVYTPFSFLLFYEVLLLVKVLPDSFSRSVGKQLQVVTLIVVRRVFKDIAKLGGNDAISLGDVEVLWAGADMVGALLLFWLTVWFLRGVRAHPDPEGEVRPFVLFKKGIALALTVIVGVLAIEALGIWALEMWHLAMGAEVVLSDVNALFDEDFFGLLVLVDVLLLVVSFSVIHDYRMVFRNAGFVASTVLVRLSFQAERLESLALLLFASGFALAVQRLTRPDPRDPVDDPEDGPAGKPAQA